MIRASKTIGAIGELQTLFSVQFPYGKEKGLDYKSNPLILLYFLARPRRFERPTLAFGGQYSIKLSYGRVFFFRKGAKHSRFASRRPSPSIARPSTARRFQVLAQAFGTVE